jgi:valyl-tRNA synthetase
VARIVSERFDYGRNFCNKLWNACRFAFLNLEGYSPAPVPAAELQVEDRWVLSRLSSAAREVTTLLERYHFDQATKTVREFTWNEFCDWYLEMLKPRLRNPETRGTAQRVLVVVVDSLLRLLHPFAPFITEELWHKLNELAPLRGFQQPAASTECVMTAAWPQLPAEWIDAGLERRFERLQQTINAVRNVRSVYGIAPGAQLKLFMRCTPDVADQLRAVAEQFDFLSKTMLEAAGLDISRPSGSASFSLGDADGYIPLEGLIDRQAELTRQTKEAEKLRGFIRGHEGKLSNAGFMAKAPEKVIAEIQETLAGLKAQLASVERMLAELSD